ncbi:hypothetical protein ABZP36_016022 [Zizania latifolia]
MASTSTSSKYAKHRWIGEGDDDEEEAEEEIEGVQSVVIGQCFCFLICDILFISEIEAICRRWLADGPKILMKKGAESVPSFKNLYAVKHELKNGKRVYCMEYHFMNSSKDQVLMLQSPIALPKAVKPHGGRRRRCGRRSHPPEGCGMLTVLEDFSRNVYKDGHGNETEEVEECGYVEDGPAEIIWQGNEITVKKNKAKVPKKAKDKQPIQQDKAHCPFYLKTADCRFGARCSSVHFYPDKSCTLLMKNMYSGPGFASEQDEGLEICKRPLSWKVGINCVLKMSVAIQSFLLTCLRNFDLSKLDFTQEERSFYMMLEEDSRQKFKDPPEDAIVATCGDIQTRNMRCV